MYICMRSIRDKSTIGIKDARGSGIHKAEDYAVWTVAVVWTKLRWGYTTVVTALPVVYTAWVVDRIVGGVVDTERAVAGARLLDQERNIRQRPEKGQRPEEARGNPYQRVD
jgi:hypothetical protein